MADRFALAIFIYRYMRAKYEGLVFSNIENA